MQRWFRAPLGPTHLGTAASKDVAIQEAGQILVEAGEVSPAYVDAMFEREKPVSTYLGNYLAIPHGTNGRKTRSASPRCR